MGGSLEFVMKVPREMPILKQISVRKKKHTHRNPETREKNKAKVKVKVKGTRTE